MRRANKRTIVSSCLLLSVLLIIGIFGLRTCGLRFWEATLHGPYQGESFNESLLGQQVVSSLALEGNRQLSVYEIEGMTVPVLALKQSDQIIWQQILLPQRTAPSGEIDTAAIRELRLNQFIKRKDHPVVRFTCDWDWGGREGGLIYLTADFAFNGFAISW